MDSICKLFDAGKIVWYCPVNSGVFLLLLCTFRQKQPKTNALQELHDVAANWLNNQIEFPL